MNKLIIQFVAADTAPEAKIGVDLELQEITRQVKTGPERKHHALIAAPAARLKHFHKALQWEHPNCVHFSAHGTQFSRIILFNEQNEPEAISNQTLGLLFNALHGQIRLVTLSYCFSHEQAKKIAELIDCVIGIEKTIPPKAATNYAAHLYGVLADGKSVGEAHELALVHLSRFNLSKGSEPQLLVRDGINPNNVFSGLKTRTTEPKKGQEICPE